MFLFSKIEHLYGLTVFENYLYATNSDNANAQQKTSVIRVNRFNSTDYQVVTRVDKGGALHIYHQRRQPRGEHIALHSPSWKKPCFLISCLLLLATTHQTKTRVSSTFSTCPLVQPSLGPHLSFLCCCWLNSFDLLGPEYATWRSTARNTSDSLSFDYRLFFGDCMFRSFCCPRFCNSAHIP